MWVDLWPVMALKVLAERCNVCGSFYMGFYMCVYEGLQLVRKSKLFYIHNDWKVSSVIGHLGKPI